MNREEPLERWTKEKSEELYGVQNWGAGYFSVSDNGELLINPYKDNNAKAVSMMDIVSGVLERGLICLCF